MYGDMGNCSGGGCSMTGCRFPCRLLNGAVEGRCHGHAPFRFEDMPETSQHKQQWIHHVRQKHQHDQNRLHRAAERHGKQYRQKYAHRPHCARHSGVVQYVRVKFWCSILPSRQRHRRSAIRTTTDRLQVTLMSGRPPGARGQVRGSSHRRGRTLSLPGQDAPWRRVGGSQPSTRIPGSQQRQASQMLIPTRLRADSHDAGAQDLWFCPDAPGGGGWGIMVAVDLAAFDIPQARLGDRRGRCARALRLCCGVDRRAHQDTYSEFLILTVDTSNKINKLMPFLPSSGALQLLYVFPRSQITAVNLPPGCIVKTKRCVR